MFDEDAEKSRISEDISNDESNIQISESMIDDALGILIDPLAQSMEAKEQYEMII